MKLRLATLLTALLSCSTLMAQPAPPEWGTILGRVIYDGKGKIPALRMVPLNKAIAPGQPAAIDDESLVVNKQNSGLANVFVYLRSKPSKIHPGYAKAPAQKVLFEAKDFRYQPHALAVWTRDEIVARNNMARGVNVGYSSPIQGTSILLPAGGAAAINLKTAESLPKPVACNIHPWMNAYLIIRDNPYFCVTDERGIFCIPNLPTNEDLEFVFWHERCGYMIGMMNQAPNPAHNTVINQRGRLSVRLTEPVLDLGEFLADPKKLK